MTEIYLHFIWKRTRNARLRFGGAEAVDDHRHDVVKCRVFEMRGLFVLLRNTYHSKVGRVRCLIVVVVVAAILVLGVAAVLQVLSGGHGHNAKPAGHLGGPLALTHARCDRGAVQLGKERVT